MEERSTNFKRIAVQGWRQFDNVEIELHARLTIITGANGAGKSSLLRIFSRHFGYDRPYLATPVLINGKFVFKAGLFESLAKKISSFFKKETGFTVGRLAYSNGDESILSIQNNNSVQYSLDFVQQSVAGLHIDSHQPVSAYQPVANIPATITTPEMAFGMYNGETLNRFMGNHTGYSPLYRMKESLIAMAMFGEPNSRSPGNPALLKALNGFVDVLRNILPPSLGFIDLIIRSPDVVLQTRTGEFLIDAASGGVTTLIDFAWRLHTFSQGKTNFVVTIDEPENHLHPSMQRSLMRRLTEAFPQAQFIVATHSPFIVSSVKDSFVYVLKYNNSGGVAMEGFIPETTTSRIISEKLDTINKSSSANEILREVLGVEATVPEWVTSDIKNIVARYSRNSVTKESLRNLRSELEGLGYGDQYPVALSELVGRQ